MKCLPLIFLIAVILSGVYVSGCTETPINPNSSPNSQETSGLPHDADTNDTDKKDTSEISDSNTDFLKITDDTGFESEIKKYPKRVISLAPSITELFFAINTEKSGAKLVGRTAYDTHPPEALLVESIGGMTTGTSIESVISKEPDLIFATTMVDTTMVSQLRDNKYPVILFHIESVDDIYKNIEVIGEVLNEKESAVSLTEKIKAEIDEISKRPHPANPPKTMYAVSADPMYVTGKNTYLNELIELAGGENIYSDTEGYFVATTESIIMRQPEVIIVIDGVMNSGIDLREQILNNKELSDIPAVKSGKVYSVDDDLISRPGPRIGEALEILYQCISGEEQ